MTSFSAWYLNTKTFDPWVYIEEAFSDEECDKILNYCKTLDLQKGKIGLGHSTNEEVVDQNVRSNGIAWIDDLNETTEWLYRKITDYVNNVNNQYWKYNIEYIPPLQYTNYSEINDHFNYHIDMMIKGTDTRKISFSIQLDAEDSYEGCDLYIKINDDDIHASRKKGSINFFPSFLLHKVTPLESGERNCIVGWVCGPDFK